MIYKLLDYSNLKLDDILLEMANLTIENMQEIYGDSMNSEDNIKMYVEYKKKMEPITYLVYDENLLVAFLTLSFEGDVLNIEDIQILKKYRNNAGLMMQFLNLMVDVYLKNTKKIKKVVYYINKKNNLSHMNFARFAKTQVELKNNYMFELNLNHPFIKRILKKHQKEL